MSRQTYLLVTSFIGLAVGLFALLAPVALLASKGVAPDGGVTVWVREVGILILSLGVVAFLVRNEPDSRTLRGVLVGNAIVHVGLLPIEINAYAHGLITRLDGIVPNSILHVVLASGFAYFAVRCQVPAPSASPRFAER